MKEPGLNDVALDVADFHVAFAPEMISPSGPRLLPPDRAKARAEWLMEEVKELFDATTIEDQADAFVDSIYFALGGLVDMGVEPQPIFDIVHNANMSKIWPDGGIHRREDGKIVKPPGWIDPAPLIKMEIARQLEIAHRLDAEEGLDNVGTNAQKV